MKKSKLRRLFVRALAIASSLSILASVIFTVPIVANADIDVWDGTTATEFAGGTGTESDPYLISNGAELFKMASEYGTGFASPAATDKKYFKITADIYLNDISKPDWSGSTAKKWIEKGWSYKFFHSLDGDGHTIYGLKSTSSGNMVGLIPVTTSGAEFKNLKLDSAYVVCAGDNYAGGFVGAHSGSGGIGNDPVKFTNCAITNSDVHNYPGAHTTGCAGFISNVFARGAEFTNCYAYDNYFSYTLTSEVIAPAFAAGGAVAGSIKLTNCYSAGNFPVGTPRVTYTGTITCTNVYTNTDANIGQTGIANVSVLDDTDMKGEAAATKMLGFDFTNIWNTTDYYPVIGDVVDGGSGGSGGGGGGEPVVNPIALNKNTSEVSYDDGDGTKENPYLISTPSQLYKMVAENGAGWGKNQQYCFKLKNDIIINDTTVDNWIEKNPNEWLSVAFNATDYYFDDTLHNYLLIV